MGVKEFQDKDFGEIQELIDTKQEQLITTWVDGDECFWISARQWGRRHRRRLEYYSKQSTTLMQSLPNYLPHFSQN